VAEAIFGLIGVVVGGLITGAVQYLTRRADSQERRRAVVRFVVDELKDVREWLEIGYEVDAWPSERVSLRTVDELRDELGKVLSDSEWEALGNTKRLLEVFELERREHVDDDASRPSKSWLVDFRFALDEVDKTLRALGIEPEKRLAERLQRGAPG
jgi:hypothetical protein